LDNPFTILVVEDNPVTQMLLEKTITQGGYPVIVVDNGSKALEVIQKQPISIVLTDWIMPEMNGIELCKIIRDQVLERYVYVLLLTGRESKEDIVQGLEAGADDYLVKPFHPAELIARIRTGTRILKLERSLNKAYREIKDISIRDMLTGCYNRHYMVKQLEYELKRIERYRHPLSLILCDIDHFKQINDQFGHLAGDQVLREFVKCLQGMIRDDLDWLARFGGEEFLIVLPETDLEGAMVLTERLRNRIQHKKIWVPGRMIRVSASFGVVEYTPSIACENISSNILINQADSYLYEAKSKGRNRAEGGRLLEEHLISLRKKII
jgi:diguanylate cyclase (GGDEF)-like protein